MVILCDDDGMDKSSKGKHQTVSALLSFAQHVKKESVFTKGEY